MSESATKQSSIANKLPWLLTPVFLVILSIGIAMLVYLLMPTHRLQNYLNIAFMDNLKVQSTTAGLNIINKDIDTNGNKETTTVGEVLYPHFGEQCATLICEEIDLTVGVYYGTTTELLALGACQSTQNKVIGDTGNVVISAHVNTFFADLSKMKVGDTVTLYTEYGIFTYRAKEAIRFQKTDKSYVTNTSTDKLTLYTCEADVLGNSDTRIGMICEPISKLYYVTTEVKE
ncbi:MAG: class D sortase [Oscillospiraceae bacterium]